MRSLFCSFGFVLLVAAFSPLSAQQLPDGFVQQLLAENLDPTDMVMAPDGRIFISIKSGSIVVVENGALLSHPFLTLEVDNYNERGLGHIVLDPDFETNSYYYAYYTVPGTNRNRVSRFTANGNYTLAGSEYVLLDLDVMNGTIHNGGAMVFDSYGKLYIAVGDGANAGAAQSLTNLHGKILRINPDGSIPDDNPFYNTASGKNRAIYALGFRNPFSMDIQPNTNRIFACDVGEGTWEEINDVLPGKNYGWPLIEGKRTNQTPPDNYEDPIHAYPHSQGCAIVGASFYNPALVAFPAAYEDQFFFADYCQGYIKRLNPSTLQVTTFTTGINRPLAIMTAPDGTMYYIARAGAGGGSEQDNTSTNNGTLWKVMYTGSGAPFVSSEPKDVLVPLGEDAIFSVSASGTQPLTYQWQMDDTDIPGAGSATYVFTNAQLADDGKAFRCVISNSFGSVTSNTATLSVTTNTRPVPVILSPATAATYKAGETLTLEGLATDAEDGELSAANLQWKIDFHHDSHHHPALGITAGVETLEYVIPQIGETSHNVWYRVYLTATDNEGLSKTVYTDVHPEKSTITLQTEPPGLTLRLDGQPITTPQTITSVIGIIRTIGAPLVHESGGTNYLFTNWIALEAEREFNFITEEIPQTFTAAFSVLPTGNGDGLKGYYYSMQSRTFLGTPAMVRTDPVIDFDWGGGSPGPGISVDNFTVRWWGEVMAQFTTTYTFRVISDDGIRLWVNNELIIDKWIPQAATEWSGTIGLIAGERYPIKLEYFEDGGAAVVKLLWQTSQLPKQIIPTSQLFTDLVTSVEEESHPHLSIYPTIVDHSITIERENNSSGLFWVMYNLVGQIVLQGMSDQTLQQIDLSHLPVGMYFIITSGSANSTTRLLKR